MCGIFGFAVKKAMPMVEVFNLLEKLEVHQFPKETKPVGGYGAGVAFLKDDGSVVLEKVGKVDVSPVVSLSKIVEAGEASVLVGHVRMPSEEFIATAKFRETAQPYVVECYSGLSIVSAHNGYVANYKEIRQKLGKKHVFESESVELIDSEVIPHLFEEKLKEKADVNEALDRVFSSLEGSSTVSLLQIEEKGTFLHFMHRGKTRGLTIWTNKQGEIVFASRKGPLIAVFGDMLAAGRFEEKVSIPWHQEANLKLSFKVKG